MNLQRLLHNANINFEAEIKDRVIRSIECDSRKLKPNDIFVAIRGDAQDGNAFIQDALNAKAFVITDVKPRKVQLDVLVVANARQAYAMLCREMAGRADQGMRMLAVTGTNGKTTCSYLLEEIFKLKGSVGLIGTVDYHYAGRVWPATHTTPDASVLHKLFLAMAESDCQTVVMEASSHALAQERLYGIDLDCALFTNLTRDHLDYHGTHEAYQAAKAKIFDLLNEAGVAVLNADDSTFQSFKDRPRILSYGIEAKADLKASELRFDLNGGSFKAVFQDQVVKFETPLVGIHNVYNILGALGVALAQGMSLAQCQPVIRDFKGVPGRLENISAGQDFHLFIDYAHTDDGLKNVLASIRPYASQNLLVLFGCGGERDRGKRPRMARIAEDYADKIVITSDNPRNESEDAILNEIQAGFSAQCHKVKRQRDRRKAIRQILMMARKDDVVVLAGKGHEDYQVLGNKKVPFSDREEALKVLGGR